MARTPTTHIRLAIATLARLRAYRASQMKLEDAGKDILPPSSDPRGGPPTWDSVLNRLLDQVDAHREAARQQRARRKVRRAEKVFRAADAANGKGAANELA